MGGTDGTRAAYLAEKNQLLSERMSDFEATLEQKDARIVELEAENQVLREALATCKEQLEHRDQSSALEDTLMTVPSFTYIEPMAPDRRSPHVDDTEELATTIGLYALGEISLGKAAERTGVTRWEMEEILSEADIEVGLGPQDMEDIEDEVDTALDIE